MATTAKRLYIGAASTTANTTLYTVPLTSTDTIITNITVVNTSTSSQTFSLGFYNASNAQTTLIHSATSIAAKTSIYIDMKQLIGDSGPWTRLNGSASATSVNFIVSGVEIT